MRISLLEGKKTIETGILAQNAQHQLRERYLKDLSTHNTPVVNAIQEVLGYFFNLYYDAEHKGLVGAPEYYVIPDGSPDAEIMEQVLREFPFFKKVD